jgi:energy-coupling factor transporter ATP-binding protein EcfA2
MRFTPVSWHYISGQFSIQAPRKRQKSDISAPRPTPKLFKFSLKTMLDSEITEHTAPEGEALADILAWSLDRPLWQRDALRRLCSVDRLSEQDIAELTILSKGQTENAVALTADHIRVPQASGAPVNLRRIHAVRNVNALAEGEILSFDKSGVTVVYGDNGAGKSGYVRVLKRVCRARSQRGDKILPNIYTRHSGSQTATIDYSVGGQNQTETWIDGQVATPLLSAVSVFDSRTANIHVDETNDLAYTPFPLKLLERLAQVCRTVKGRLDAEIAAIEQQTPAVLRNPACSPESRVGHLIFSLNDATGATTVDSLVLLNDEEEARLSALQSDLAQDPQRAARQLEQLKERLDKYIVALSKLADGINPDKQDQLRALYRDFQSKEMATSIAASELFTSEPLPDVGSETWRALWQAARQYSLASAYPKHSFPYIGDEALCVLCHQMLSDEAKHRLGSFENFVQDWTKQQELEARHHYEAFLSQFSGANIRLSEAMQVLALIRDELDDYDLAYAVRRFVIAAKWRLRRVLRDHLHDSPRPDAPEAPPLPIAELHAKSEALDLRARTMLLEESSELRQRLRQELQQLLDRKWLSGVKADVLAEIDRRKQIASLKEAQKDMATNTITSKSSALSETLVTNSLRGRFAQEITRLGIADLAIELRRVSSSYGVPQFKVCLIHKPDAHTGSVLSEGEHRCVALAAFLAELATTDTQSTIVFDDPVSSLDHMHREAVAKRLAEEAKTRQIIIFTHDIVFLFLINDACRQVGTHIGFRSITKGAENAGYCHLEPPANAQHVEKAIESIQKQLDNQKVQYERGLQADWYRTVRSLQEQLRTAWERGVEAVIAPVLRRLSSKVDTTGLIKLTVLCADDCQVMREAFGRCSALLHSAPDALNPPLPAPNQIQTEIDFLRDWVQRIKGRQNNITCYRYNIT